MKCCNRESNDYIRSFPYWARNTQMRTFLTHAASSILLQLGTRSKLCVNHSSEDWILQLLRRYFNWLRTLNEKCNAANSKTHHSKQSHLEKARFREGAADEEEGSDDRGGGSRDVLDFSRVAGALGAGGFAVGFLALGLGAFFGMAFSGAGGFFRFFLLALLLLLSVSLLLLLLLLLAAPSSSTGSSDFSSSLDASGMSASSLSSPVASTSPFATRSKASRMLATEGCPDMSCHSRSHSKPTRDIRRTKLLDGMEPCLHE